MLGISENERMAGVTGVTVIIILLKINAIEIVGIAIPNTETNINLR